jgi:PAS domain-containing protein
LGGRRLFAGIVRDITQQKRIEDAEAKASAVLDAAVDGILTINDHGTVKSFNRAAEGIFGYASDEVIGRNINMLMPEPVPGAKSRAGMRLSEVASTLCGPDLFLACRFQRRSPFAGCRVATLRP